MYRKILVALENSDADASLLPHIAELAGQLKSSLLLVHVADGWAARNYEKLKLIESDEIKADRAYLARTAEGLRAKGLAVDAHLAMGDPPTEIIRTAEQSIATSLPWPATAIGSSATSFRQHHSSGSP